MIGLIDYLQWYLVETSSLSNMVKQLFSSEAKSLLESGQPSDESEYCNSFCKLATESPDTPWVSHATVAHACVMTCTHIKL